MDKNFLPCKRNLFVIILLLSSRLLAQPVTTYPGNPHYYMYKGKPIVLITSAEHYGAVINADFDYEAYFKTLKQFNLNNTRIYPGFLFEPADKFIKDNTLAPRPQSLLLPWLKIKQSNDDTGNYKYDLSRWDTVYFKRLKNFIASAAKYDIIVEICFFNAQYDDTWPISPLNYKNNINGIGNVATNDCQTLNDPGLVNHEKRYVEKIMEEVNEFDNVILEICDEPIQNGTDPKLAGQWLRYMLKAVADKRKTLPKKQIVAQQIVGLWNVDCDLSDEKELNSLVGQYIWYEFGGKQFGGKEVLDNKYHLNKPVELNETNYYPVGYTGEPIASSRVEAWEFIVAGGACFNHLNGRFTAKQPDGLTEDNIKILTALKSLTTFINSFDFIKMKPDIKWVQSGLPAHAFVRGICLPGEQYALYVHHSYIGKWGTEYVVMPGNYKMKLKLDLPAGSYTVKWIETETGTPLKEERITSTGKGSIVMSPAYVADIALSVKRNKR